MLCGIYLVWQVGIELLWIILVGVAISIFYSAKPFRFAYHGIGEVMMLLGYGPVFTLGGYYVHSMKITPEILLIGAIPGLLQWTMILINEIPDYEEDRAANKKNIVFRLGPKNTKNLFIASLVGINLYIAVLLFLRILPPPCALAFFGIPLMAKASVIANKYYLQPLQIAPANQFMVFIYSTITVALSIGFLI
jgi:1,4-dihydroxy-2-naphthoate octaprenyltransferase